jgi:beta-glucosidase
VIQQYAVAVPHFSHPFISHATQGRAIADVVFGKASPAGRLPFSWPTTATDVLPEADYTMVGRTYRYDQKNVKWSFGHGLSYSTFAYDAKATSIQHSSISAASCTPVGITVAVANSGNVASDEVVQAYIRWASTSPAQATPSMSLVDFSRVNIEAGVATHVSLTMLPRSLAILTDPRCGVVPHTADTALAGDPFQTMKVGTGDAGAAIAVV